MIISVVLLTNVSVMVSAGVPVEKSDAVSTVVSEAVLICVVVGDVAAAVDSTIVSTVVSAVVCVLASIVSPVVLIVSLASVADSDTVVADEADVVSDVGPGPLVGVTPLLLLTVDPVEPSPVLLSLLLLPGSVDAVSRVVA